MKHLFHTKKILFIAFLWSIGFIAGSHAQTVVNGFYPSQNDLTVAVSYGYKSYERFFIGNTLGDGNPAMLGDINSSIYNLYGEYGITDWLSATLTLPYITVESEAGNPDPVQNESKVSGIQDLAVYLKAKALEANFSGGSRISMGGAISYSLPVGGYEGGGVLSLGNEANNLSAVGIVQITTSYNLFTEFQGGYSLRNSSDFDIPNATIFSGKLGYFNDYFYVDTKIGIQNSQSGLDIGTPEFGEAGAAAVLPETNVDYTELSFNLYVPFYKNMLGASASYATTLEGRNYNDASGFSIGLVYTLR